MLLRLYFTIWTEGICQWPRSIFPISSFLFFFSITPWLHTRFDSGIWSMLLGSHDTSVILTLNPRNDYHGHQLMIRFVFIPSEVFFLYHLFFLLFISCFAVMSSWHSFPNHILLIWFFLPSCFFPSGYLKFLLHIGNLFLSMRLWMSCSVDVLSYVIVCFVCVFRRCVVLFFMLHLVIL